MSETGWGEMKKETSKSVVVRLSKSAERGKVEGVIPFNGGGKNWLDHWQTTLGGDSAGGKGGGRARVIGLAGGAPQGGDSAVTTPNEKWINVNMVA